MQPGNYIYVIESAPSKLLPLYIGQTHDVNQRLLEHDFEFDLFRATHLCVHFNYYEYGAFGRLAEEKDLIERWRPACNRSTQKLPSVGRVGCPEEAYRDKSMPTKSKLHGMNDCRIRSVRVT